MVFWILIASTGTQAYLQETLDSVTNLPGLVEKKVVVSLSPVGDKKEFTGAEIILRDKALQQFDHYECLAKELPIQDDDRVLVLDDDDLLLPNTPLSDQGSYVGMQILVDDEVVTTTYDLLSRCPIIHQVIVEAKIRVVDDLSGTTTNGRSFKEYFTTKRPRIKIMEDTVYMNYIEKLETGKKYPTPFVIHRLKSSPSIWQKDLIKIFKGVITATDA